MDHDQKIGSPNQIMEGAVTEYAVKLHSIFRKIINKYGEESVCELFPFCIEVLENFNYHIGNNEKLSLAYNELVKQYEDLSEAMEKLKISRQKDLEKSLGIEDDLEQELYESQEKIHTLEHKQKHLLDDLDRKNETIDYFNDTINCLNVQIENLLNEKLSLQNEIAMLRSQFYFPFQYPTISVPIAVQALSLNVFQRVPAQENVITQDIPHPNESKRRKRKIHLNANFSLYSDNQGKDLSTLLKKQFANKNIFIKPSLVKSGAPLLEIVRAIKLDANTFEENDYVAVIGGSNDIGFYNPEEIIKAYNDLLKCNLNCKYIITTIPPRYDLSPYCSKNDLIRAINAKIKNLTREYDNVKILDLGSKNRRFFTADGKHFNPAGKTSMVKDFYKIISKW